MPTFDLTLRLAQIAEHNGRRDEAASHYAEILRGNPYLIEAWWGLSQTVDNAEHVQYCLGRVLAITPYHSVMGQRRKDQALRLLSPQDRKFGPTPKVDRRRRTERRHAV